MRNYGTSQYCSVLSKIAEDGSMGTVIRYLWPGYSCQIIEDINSCQPEVEASQSDKQLRSYDRRLKITITWQGFQTWKNHGIWKKAKIMEFQNALIMEKSCNFVLRFCALLLRFFPHTMHASYNDFVCRLFSVLWSPCATFWGWRQH